MSRLQNERLKLYLEAEKAVLSGQSYTIWQLYEKPLMIYWRMAPLWTRTNAYQRGQEKELSFSDKEDI